MNPSIDYLAGYFDGEGCVSLSKQTTPCLYYQRRVSICSANKPILEYLKFKYGGQVCLNTKADRKSTKKNIYEWYLTKKELILKFLQEIYPNSIEKKEQIKYMIDLCDNKKYETDELERAFIPLKKLKRKSY